MESPGDVTISLETAFGDVLGGETILDKLVI